MLSNSLLATLLAAATIGSATSAMAFGDLDCIGTGISTCDGPSCAPLLLNFPLLFNWTDNTATFPHDDTIIVVPLVAQDTSDGGTSGQMAFGTPDGPYAGTSLLLDFTGPEISARYTVGQDRPIHYATCAPQEAV